MQVRDSSCASWPVSFFSRIYMLVGFILSATLTPMVLLVKSMSETQNLSFLKSPSKMKSKFRSFVIVKI